MAHKTSLAFLTHPTRPLSQHVVTKSQNLFVSYNLAIEAAAQQFYELPGNTKPAYTAHNSAGTSYLELESGRLEGMGCAVLKGMSDINCDSELFAELMKSVSL